MKSKLTNLTQTELRKQLSADYGLMTYLIIEKSLRHV